LYVEHNLQGHEPARCRALNNLISRLLCHYNLVFLVDPASRSSYRPISNLSFLSELIEHVVAKRFVHHAEVNRLFPVHQSSYRRGHSTETAVLSVHNDLVRAVDEKHTAALVLLDLSAAFDTVDHLTLRVVLQRRFGIRGLALQWFTSYLSDRTQVFCMNGTESQPISV